MGIVMKNFGQEILKKFKNVDIFYIWVIMLLALKLFLMRDVRIQAQPTAIADDELMVTLAESLKEFKWLGEYNKYTLVKGMFFPAFLALGSLLHINYISWVQIFYCIACTVFVRAIKPMTKKRWAEFLLYALLLFNPIMASTEVIQRVYRNSITAAQVLFVFGGYIGLYYSCAERRRSWIKWIASAAFGFVSLYQSREDAIWIVPFMLVATACVIYRRWRIGELSLNALKAKKSAFAKGALILLLPFLVHAACRGAIAFKNHAAYGVWTDNELRTGSFPRVVQDIYAIDMEEPADYTSAGREKMEAVYKVSPTLSSIKVALDAVMDNYATSVDRVEQNSVEGNVENGWFFWALRDAAGSCGFYATAWQSERFWDDVADEIEAAFADGTFKKQATMPSALMPPWEKGMLPKLLKTMGEAADYVAFYREVDAFDVPSIDDGEGGIARFEAITGNEAVPEDSNPYGAGSENFWIRIANVWQVIGGPIAIAGRLCFVVLVVLFFMRRLSDDNKSSLLMLVGIGGGLLCLYAGIAYNELRSCRTISYMYLCGAYSAAMVFDLMSVLVTVRIALSYFCGRTKHTKRLND